MHQLVLPFFLESLVGVNFAPKVIAFRVQEILSVLRQVNWRPYLFHRAQVGILTCARKFSKVLFCLALVLHMSLVFVFECFYAFFVEDLLYCLQQICLFSTALILKARRQSFVFLREFPMWWAGSISEEVLSWKLDYLVAFLRSIKISQHWTILCHIRVFYLVHWYLSRQQKSRIGRHSLREDDYARWRFGLHYSLALSELGIQLDSSVRLLNMDTLRTFICLVVSYWIKLRV